jgi:predicted MFS family arabinose efflux permease
VRLFARLFRLVWGEEVDRRLRPILVVGLAGSVAGSMVWTFVGLWAIRKLHAGQATVGLAYLVSALIGVGAGYLGGHLSDHVGRKPLIVASWVLQPLLMVGFLTAGSNERVGIGLMCLGGLFFQIGSAADTALVADVVPPERHEAAYASVRVANNLGVTVGPALGGLLIALASWRGLFAGAAVVAVVTVLLALRFLPTTGEYAAKEPPTRGSLPVIARDRTFLVFLLSSALAWLVYVAFEVIAPISLVQSHGYAPATWGFVLIVNPVLVTLFQLRVIRWTQGISAAVKLAVGLPLMGVPFLLFPALRPVPVVVVVAVLVLFVIGEMLWVPSSQSIVAGLAPVDIRGAYMGAFGSMAAFGFAFAPFIGLRVRSSYGDGAVWTLFAALSVAAGLLGAAACRIAAGRMRAGEAAAAVSRLGA